LRGLFLLRVWTEFLNTFTNKIVQYHLGHESLPVQYFSDTDSGQYYSCILAFSSWRMSVPLLQAMTLALREASSSSLASSFSRMNPLLGITTSRPLRQEVGQRSFPPSPAYNTRSYSTPLSNCSDRYPSRTLLLQRLTGQWAQSWEW